MRAVRLHQLLIVAAVLVPAALFAGAAVENRRDVLREGRDTVERTTSILHEHARKVFETEELVLGRIADRIQGMSDAEIAAPQTSAFLAELKAPLDQAVSIWISAADGTMLAGSQDWQRGTGIAGREFFEMQRDHDAGLYVSKVFDGKATQISSFAVIRRRPAPDGSFRGTIHVALSPAYFRRVFREASPPYPSLAALVRADGEILAREPERPGYPTLAGDSALRRTIAEHPLGGSYDSVSSFNGEAQINAFRKVGAYPVYVRFGVEKRVLLSRWYHNLAIYGASAAGASAVLLIVSWLALSRARAEEDALLRLRVETEQRLLAEEQLRHAMR